MWRKAYIVMVVGIGLLTVCERFASTTFVPTPADGIANVIWWFVQGGAAVCAGFDLFRFLQRRRQW